MKDPVPRVRPGQPGGPRRVGRHLRARAAPDPAPAPDLEPPGQPQLTLPAPPGCPSRRPSRCERPRLLECVVNVSEGRDAARRGRHRRGRGGLPARRAQRPRPPPLGPDPGRTRPAPRGGRAGRGPGRRRAHRPPPARRASIPASASLDVVPFVPLGPGGSPAGPGPTSPRPSRPGTASPPGPAASSACPVSSTGPSAACPRCGARPSAGSLPTPGRPNRTRAPGPVPWAPARPGGLQRVARPPPTWPWPAPWPAAIRGPARAGPGAGGGGRDPGVVQPPRPRRWSGPPRSTTPCDSLAEEAGTARRPGRARRPGACRGRRRRAHRRRRPCSTWPGPHDRSTPGGGPAPPEGVRPPAPGGRGSRSRSGCRGAAAHGASSTQTPTLTLGEPSPDPELLTVGQRVLETVLAHDAATADFLRFARGCTTLREEQIRIYSHAVGPRLPVAVLAAVQQ